MVTKHKTRKGGHVWTQEEKEALLLEVLGKDTPGETPPTSDSGIRGESCEETPLL